MLPRALHHARLIAKASPLAVRQTLKTLRSQQEEGLDLALRREADAQAICYASKVGSGGKTFSCWYLANS